MKPNTREPQAPESYGTFWEPVTVAAPPAPPAPPKASDAYLEFTNVTEDSPTALRGDRA